MSAHPIFGAILILILLGTMLVTGCDSSDETLDPVTLQLNWFHEAEFVGYYVADALGFYHDNQIEVSIIEGGPGIAARLRVLDGSADFAISTFGEQQKLVDEGQPTVAVMSVFQLPPLVMFSLADAGITKPADLVGKRIGIKNSYWHNIAHQTLINAGIDPSGVIDVDVDAEAKNLLYEGKVDVWMGYVHDEPIEAQVAGYEVTNIYPAKYGVGGYEGLLLANQSTLDQNHDVTTRFVQASLRGWQYAVEHPDEAALIMTEWQPHDSLEFQKLAVRALIPLVDLPQYSIGWIDSERWENLMGLGFKAQQPGYTMQFFEAAD